MDIKIITCHNVANYGAALQALALQTYIEEKGHDVKIINYVPEYLNSYNLWNVPKSSRLYKLSQHSRLVLAIYAMKTYVSIRATQKRVNAFNEFHKKFFHLTEKFTSYDEIVSNPPKADLYIAGSDQIWSTFLKNGRDPSFYCAFGSNSTKRISYAASFGFPELFGYDCFVKSMLLGFDDISIREETGVNIARNLNIKATQVVDPVLLLDKDKWINILRIKNKIIKYKYLLVYDIFLSDERMKKNAERIALNKGLKIIAINDIKPNPYADINVNDGGPQEFINLIANAEYVLADSFHATAFSIIFRKPFCIFYTKSNISRIKDFLSSVNLKNRLNPDSEIPDTINWNEVEHLLREKIRTSKNFLNAHLG